MLEHRKEFGRALMALEPYLGHLVVAGSWAHRLFPQHPLAGPSRIQPLGTDDADFATSDRYRPSSPTALHQALLEAGFRQDLSGSTEPPATAYYLGDDDGFHLEFIAPLIGSRTDRKGADRPPIRIGGVTAQTLRFVEILLAAPWRLELTPDGPIPVEKRLRVQVASPSAYLLQKVLSAPRRSSDKGPKDLLYIYDTLMLFSANLGHLRPEAAAALQVLPRKQRAEALGLSDSLPGREDFVAGAVRIALASGRPDPPSAGQVTATCRAGLRLIFAPGE